MFRVRPVIFECAKLMIVGVVQNHTPAHLPDVPVGLLNIVLVILDLVAVRQDLDLDHVPDLVQILDQHRIQFLVEHHALDLVHVRILDLVATHVLVLIKLHVYQKMFVHFYHFKAIT